MNPSEHDNGIVPARGESSPQRGENLTYPADEFAAMDDALFAQVSRLIKESHARVSATVNAEMTELYWRVGNAINEDLLGGKRAEYGAQVIQKLSARLTQAYGRGWSAQQLRHCRRLASTFSYEIISALRRVCSGKNDEHVELLGLDEGSIRVAEYMTKLPDMDVLEEKLRLSIERARRKLEAGV